MAFTHAILANSHQKTWPYCSACVKVTQYHQDLPVLPTILENAFCKHTNKLLTKHVLKVSQRKKQSDKNSKHENPYGSLWNGDFSSRDSLLPTNKYLKIPIVGIFPTSGNTDCVAYVTFMVAVFPTW